MPRLTCVAVRQETPTVKTFTFQADEPIAYEPGHSLTLALPVGDETLRRTFSLSSPAGPDGRVEITIKAHPEGRATRWLHDTLAAGVAVTASRPRGRFTLAKRENGAPLAFISGGSGATPLMAMLRHLAATEPEADIAWFHAAREPPEILFAAELSSLQAVMPNLHVAVMVSRPQPGWFGFRGRVSRRLLSVAAPDFARRTVFCCGPSAFMDEARLIHAAEGGKADRFHVEHFGPAPMAAAPSPSVAVEPGHRLVIGDRQIEVAAGETILRAALRNGIVIPCGCGQGLCGTCRMRRLSGDMVMSHQGGLSPEEEGDGLILACSTYLRSAARLDFTR